MRRIPLVLGALALGCSSNGTSAGAAGGDSGGASSAGAATGGVSTGGSSTGGAKPALGCTLGLPSVDYGSATAPAQQWSPITNNLAGLASECGNVNGVFPHTHMDLLVAGIARQGLWSSVDGGETWQQLGTKSTSDNRILNRTSTVLFDPDRASRFWEAGIYGWEDPWTQGVFETNDNGESFSGYLQLSIVQSHQDSISVDFCDPERKTQLSGGHEQKQVLFLSTDGGANFTDVGTALSATSFCTNALVLDAETLLVGCAQSWSGSPGAIERSADGGKTWTSASAQGVFGHPLWASDGTIYWAAEGGGLVKSGDRGKTWTPVGDASTAGQVAPMELPGGRIASAANSRMTVSDDGGKTWTPVGPALPFQPNGASYSPFRRAFYAWYFTCTGSNAVPADSIQRLGYDWQ